MIRSPFRSLLSDCRRKGFADPGDFGHLPELREKIGHETWIWSSRIWVFLLHRSMRGERVLISRRRPRRHGSDDGETVAEYPRPDRRGGGRIIHDMEKTAIQEGLQRRSFGLRRSVLWKRPPDWQRSFWKRFRGKQITTSIPLPEPSVLRIEINREMTALQHLLDRCEICSPRGRLRFSVTTPGGPQSEAGLPGPGS